MTKAESIREFVDRQPRLLTAAELALAGSLVLGACSDDSDAPRNVGRSDTSHVSSDKLPKPKRVTFDARGGGPDKIFVYQGPGTTPEDRIPVDHYNNGESAKAFCRAIGRTVYTHPEVGEDRDNSPVWVQVQAYPTPDGRPAPTEWAAAVYLHHPLPSLPDCAG